MADIFVSYSRVDRDSVAPIVAMLEAQGWSVWWDTALRAGEQWDEVIEREIKAARCIVVVWSQVSVTRRWVRVEANFGLGRDNLVPVIIDDAEQPLAFSLVQAAKLGGWNGDQTSAVARRVVADVRDKLSATPLSPAPSVPLAASGEAGGMPTSMQSTHDWSLIESSTDPRDFRAFIEEHPQGLLTRRARHRLSDLADAAWATVKNAQDAGELQRFLRLHFDSEHAETAKAILASLEAEAERRRAQEAAAREAEARQRAEQQRRQEEAERAREAEVQRYRTEGRIQIKVGSGQNDLIMWPKPGAGEVFRDIDIGPEMVVVPAGTFMMGESGSQKQVTIEQPFAIGRFTLTFDEWDAAQAHPDWQRQAGIAPRKANDHGWGRGRQPAIDVSWEDAKAYCKWLSAVTSKTYRLPSEAEWEYCCRAGTTTEFWWGNDISTEQANYDCRTGEYRRRTVPVESFKPNPWGLYQVHGNVLEWCEDGFDPSSRVLRGGSWACFHLDLRSADRFRNDPTIRYLFVGFRLARTL